MNVYNVWADKCDYDQFDNIIVVAENEDRALEMVNTGYLGKCYFMSNQGEIHVDKVDLTIEHIVLESFNAG